MWAYRWTDAFSFPLAATAAVSWMCWPLCTRVEADCAARDLQRQRAGRGKKFEVV